MVKMTLMMSSMKIGEEDPWRGIESPKARTEINARRLLDIGSPSWGLYWAVDSDHHCLLVLQYQSGSSRERELPVLKGVEVSTPISDNHSVKRVYLRLMDGEQRSLFKRFCVDVVESTRIAENPEEAYERFLTRTWRWHHLLRSGHDERLSISQQRGLIGELHVIENHLIPVMTIQNVLDSWEGPLGSQKDFLMGLISLEVKSRSSQKAEVRIASLDQLDAAEADRLFLYVVEIVRATDTSIDAVTVTDLATRVKTVIASEDENSAYMFEERLSASGFDWEDDYSAYRWVIGDSRLYEIEDGFPRVIPPMVSNAIKNVSYSIDLSGCRGFQTPINVLYKAISGEIDDP